MESYNPTDLLEFGVRKHLKKPIYERLKAAIKDAHVAINFTSNVIEDFFYEISSDHTKRRFRLILKFYLLYSCCFIMFSPIIYPGNSEKLFNSILYCTIGILCFFITYYNLSYHSYSKLSILTIIILFGFYMYSISDLITTTELAYTPLIQTIVLMLAILPINLEVTIACSVLYIAIYQMMLYCRLVIPGNTAPFRSHGTFGIYPIIPVMENNIPAATKKKLQSNFMRGQIMILISCQYIGMYLNFSNSLRRRASFLRLGETVKAQRDVKKAYDDQMQCISAIMPAEIKMEYMTSKLKNVHDEMWLYTKNYSNVSILFADIVGFTKMSSNKTAPQVVTLLNDLFNRFDHMCKLTNCEKIATLGDCYYCIAGCPSLRQDHALCCIEMGLGMCRTIQVFNKDYHESVDMRIGVHTGRVNAAIIGEKRFRFDVYSNDVLLANETESTGLPGRVHITEPTYFVVSEIYEFEKGEDIEIKREVAQGIQGMQLKLIKMPTYFIKPESSKLIEKTILIEKGDTQLKFEIVKNKKRVLKKEADNSDRSNEEEKVEVTDLNTRIEQDAINVFIDALRKDPDKQIKLFENPPIWPMSLRYIDEEIEDHHHRHTQNEQRPISVHSVKLAPLFDSIACLVFSIIFTGAVALFMPSLMSKKGVVVCILHGVSFLIVLIIAWSSVSLEPFIKNPTIRVLFLIFSNRFAHHILGNIMCCLPVCILFLALDCKALHKDHLYTAAFFGVSLLSLLGFTLLVSSVAWISLLFVFTIVSLYIYKMYTCSDLSKCSAPNVGWCNASYPCRKMVDVVWDKAWDRHIYPIIINYLLTCYVVIQLTRENETNLRLCFYVSREAEIKSEEAAQVMKASETLLNNIIPKYALDEIILRGGDLSKGNFSYAVNIKNAGVIFACISNFFSQYYREDYKGGEGALRLLNKIITMWDLQVNEKKYRDVEKIKTINDCYMMASGLNNERTKRNKDPKQHLKALLAFCFDMQRILVEFNNLFVFGKDKFEMKIGYNIGPVTAGVIGTTKPMYDIWGDTVNVSSRMYSTGVPGCVQVPLRVKDILVNSFKFTFKGIVAVKGKGDMETYLATERPAKKRKQPVHKM